VTIPTVVTLLFALFHLALLIRDLLRGHRSTSWPLRCSRLAPFWKWRFDFLDLLRGLGVYTQRDRPQGQAPTGYV